MKAIQLLINRLLPEELRDYTRAYDAKSVGKLLATVAEKYPDRYADITKGIADIGRKATYLQGETLTLEDMRPTFDRAPVLAKMDVEIDKARKQAKTDAEFHRLRDEIWTRYSDDFEKLTADSALAQGNNLAMSVVSGARGKGAQLKAMITTPGLYADYRGRAIPVFSRNSFAEGLRPGEFLAGTFGARASVLSTKIGTAKGGDIGKQCAQVASRLVITTKDCGTTNGIDLDATDASLRGRVLAADCNGVKAGTVIDRHVLKQLQGYKGKVLVRSAMTCSAEHGLCAKCAGAKMHGLLPHIGESVGVQAAQAIGEPLAQNALSCLVAGTRVRMADFSVKKIEDIRPGDMVMGADMTANTFPVKVTKLWDQGIQPVQRYTYRMGSSRSTVSVDCTKEHIILQNKKIYAIEHKLKGNGGPSAHAHPDNYKAAKLPAGYQQKSIAAVLANDCLIESGINEPMAVMLGVYLGDGIRVSDISHQISISCADILQIESLNSVLKPLGLVLRKNKRSFDWRIVQTNQKDSARTSKGTFLAGEIRNLMRQKLVDWGLVGKYSYEKTIPPCVWSWDKKSVEAMIGGYLATDGSIYLTKSRDLHISFASTSKTMLDELKQLLSVRFGLHAAGVYLSNKEITNRRKRHLWMLNVARQDQVLKFLKQITAIPGIKGGKRKVFLEDLKFKLRHNEPFYIAKRSSVQELGDMQCWDLSVDHPDELFVLENGMIVKNSKHTAGQAAGQRTYSGLDTITQILQTPEVFPDKAEVAQEAGRVAKIEPAPQGGSYVTIGESKHYIHPDYPLTVKVGNHLEAGEPLSEGIIDPSDIVRLRGLGSGRRYYSQRLKQVLDDSGLHANLRNTEMMARAAIDHVTIDDAEGVGEFMPDDVVSYNRLAQVYTPPTDTKKASVGPGLSGKYLYSPALHYTVGTKLTEKMAKRIQDAGIREVHVSDEAPKFVPGMVRLRAAGHSNNDWLARMSTSYLKSNLADAAARGDDTDVGSNINWQPRLAVGVGFGQNAGTTGKF